MKANYNFNNQLYSRRSGSGSVRFIGGCYDIIGLLGNAHSLNERFFQGWIVTLSASCPHLFLHRCIVSDHRKCLSISLYIRTHSKHIPASENTDLWLSPFGFVSRWHTCRRKPNVFGSFINSTKCQQKWIQFAHIGVSLVLTGDCITC